MTLEIATVLAVLALTVILFVTEALRVDVIAIAVMLLLPWLGAITPAEAFSGLAGNAVVSVLAVMILSDGVERSGVMSRLTRPILRLAGAKESRILALIAGTVGLISAFMQNIGAAALFLPVMHRISQRARVPLSRLLMPMGFAAILGGTLTLVGSGPLIILNDLLRQAGQPAYGLFSVTPLGLALLAGGLLCFMLLGHVILPAGRPGETRPSPQRELIETWGLPETILRARVPAGSALAGQTRESVDLWRRYGLNLLAIVQDGDVTYAPWRHLPFAAGQELILMGDAEAFRRFAADHGLAPLPADDDDHGLPPCAVFAELIVPPGAAVAGSTLRQLELRKHYGVEPVLLLDRDATRRDDFSDVPLQAGSAMIVFGPCAHIRTLAASPDFRLLTPLPDDGGGRHARPLPAVLCGVGAIALALAGVNLGLALFSGVLAMILLRVLTIDEAYQAVDWRTVFLLAGLIPLGIAMEKSGGAAFLAGQMMRVLAGGHPLLILTGIAVLATLFSLFMSNVAATVLLVPLVVAIGGATGLSPRALALLVAVCASNSFLLPTHQVNALLMAPGGYRNADYLRAGGVMSVLFITIAVALTYLLYL
ncbi:MAG: Sodium-dependent dicarboxylate transporter SdcS [Lentisphaerae bacterium ADurb.BinA184]|nr:MAG: Sodium-dependent dicarboxylate transporter SdcS [Lentisphaerae bacterium ADurb.BinA184]